MNVQTLEVAGKRFVIVPEKDFRRLQTKLKVLEGQETGDVAESKRRKSQGPSRPYAALRKKLGLA